MVGGIGFVTGVVALITIHELGKRWQEHLRTHTRQITTSVNRQIDEQDAYLEKELKKIRIKVDDMDALMDGTNRVIAELRAKSVAFEAHMESIQKAEKRRSALRKLGVR